jgi:hypothetical protein
MKKMLFAGAIPMHLLCSLVASSPRMQSCAEPPFNALRPWLALGIASLFVFVYYVVEEAQKSVERSQLLRVTQDEHDVVMAMRSDK